MVSKELKFLDVRRFPMDIYLLNVNGRITRTRCEICLKLTIKTPERFKSMSAVSVVDFEQINVYRVASNSENLYMTTTDKTSRSSHQRCSMKKGVLRKFAKLTGKHLCQSLF